MAPKTPEELLKSYRKLESNKTCPNCGHYNEFGYGNVCVKFKTFVCDLCKTSHQAISHRVKSITMSAWTFEEVSELGDESGGGNDCARHVWLGNAPPVGASYGGGRRPKDGDKIEVYKNFIIDCYEHQKFKATTPYQSGKQSSKTSVTEAKTAVSTKSQGPVAAVPVLTTSLIDFMSDASPPVAAAPTQSLSGRTAPAAAPDQFAAFAPSTAPTPGGAARTTPSSALDPFLLEVDSHFQRAEISHTSSMASTSSGRGTAPDNDWSDFIGGSGFASSSKSEAHVSFDPFATHAAPLVPLAPFTAPVYSSPSPPSLPATPTASATTPRNLDASMAAVLGLLQAAPTGPSAPRAPTSLDSSARFSAFSELVSPPAMPPRPMAPHHSSLPQVYRPPMGGVPMGMGPPVGGPGPFNYGAAPLAPAQNWNGQQPPLAAPYGSVLRPSPSNNDFDPFSGLSR